PEKMQVTTYDVSLPDGLTVESVTQLFFPGEETTRTDYKSGPNIQGNQNGWIFTMYDYSYDETLWVNNQWIGTPQDCKRMSWWNYEYPKRGQVDWAYESMREAQDSAMHGPIYAQLTKPTTNTAQMAKFVAEAEKILTQTNYTGYRLSTAQQFTPDVLQEFINATGIHTTDYSGGDLYWIEFEVYEPETPEGTSKVDFVFTDEGLFRVEFSGLHKNYQVVSEVRICSPQKAFENVSEMMIERSDVDNYTLHHVELVSSMREDGRCRPRWVFIFREEREWELEDGTKLPAYFFSHADADAETGELLTDSEYGSQKQYLSSPAIIPVTKYNAVEQ
ncbi:MAG: hypothetical protein IJY28_01720, partial [Clostridia bacterium]|nr:hypothetical protein [Clostridia bacterium]